MNLLDRLERGLVKVNVILQAHPGRLVAAMLLTLGGFGAAALAVVPALGNDNIAQTLLLQDLEPVGLPAQAEALAEHRLVLSRSDKTRSGDTAASLLKRLGVQDAAAAVFLRNDDVARSLLQGRAGKMVLARASDRGELVELVARFAPDDSELANTHFTRLSVVREGQQWQARSERVALGRAVRLGSGTVRSSLFAATDDARIPDGVATQLTEIFASEIDFHRELRKGDTFNVIYETLTADGEPAAWLNAAGKVLAAEFVNKGRVHQAMWFAGGHGRGSYFGFDGRSRRRAFLASPLEFSRMTSGFAMRQHPLSNNWRAHLGVDYAAPQGTAVRSVGDGVIEFAGRQNGYGNVVQVRHSQERSTLYAHLSAIDVKNGQRIEQGQRIGAVGATGFATGPHLHFEFRVRGVHQDPLQLAMAADTNLVDDASKARFSQQLPDVKAQLQIAASLSGARAQLE